MWQRGKLILNIVDMETGKSVAKVSRKISNLKDFDYTDFNTDVQLQKGNHYAIQISTVGDGVRKRTDRLSVEYKGDRL